VCVNCVNFLFQKVQYKVKVFASHLHIFFAKPLFHPYSLILLTPLFYSYQGEALADLLRLPQCNLRTLKVDWNLIRLDGAVDFAQSISINDTLTYLDLSFNSLGTEGGVMMGVSILTNHRLETLILTSNNIDSVACFTICAGVIENRGLKKVVLDGNPIGEQVCVNL
jgi:hypothetical protein